MLTHSTAMQIKKDLSSGHPRTRLLYSACTFSRDLLTNKSPPVTPEGMNSEPFKSILKKLYKQGELNRFIVDEAHCIVVSPPFAHDVMLTDLRNGATTSATNISNWALSARSSLTCRLWRSPRARRPSRSHQS